MYYISLSMPMKAKTFSWNWMILHPFVTKLKNIDLSQTMLIWSTMLRYSINVKIKFDPSWEQIKVTLHNMVWIWIKKRIKWSNWFIHWKQRRAHLFYQMMDLENTQEEYHKHIIWNHLRLPYLLVYYKINFWNICSLSTSSLCAMWYYRKIGWINTWYTWSGKNINSVKYPYCEPHYWNRLVKSIYQSFKIAYWSL